MSTPKKQRRRTEDELIDVAAATMKRALETDDVWWVMEQALRMVPSLDYELRGALKCGEKKMFGRFYKDRLGKLSVRERRRILRGLWEQHITHPDHASPKLARIMIGASMKVLDGWKGEER